jgi:acyl-CoA synthetase (AMP-forming)/AMP-acid ligase II
VQVVNLNIHLVARELAFAVTTSAPHIIVTDPARADVLCDALNEADFFSSCIALPDVLWVGGMPSASLLSRLSELGVTSAVYEAALAGSQPVSAANLADALLALPMSNPAAPFQYYFTSGTTGNPKLVMLTLDVSISPAPPAPRAQFSDAGCCESRPWHRCRDAFARRRCLASRSPGMLLSYMLLRPLRPTILQTFHLVDAFSIYAIVRVAGRHVFLPSFSVSTCHSIMEQENVSVSNVASTMLMLLASSPASQFFDLSSLRCLSCGGSPLLAADVNRALSTFACEIFISYGESASTAALQTRQASRVQT